MLNIDIYNGEKPSKNLLAATANFNDLTATYWGYIYRLDNGEIIGDYTADSSEEIAKAFRVAWRT